MSTEYLSDADMEFFHQALQGVALIPFSGRVDSDRHEPTTNPTNGGQA